MLVELIALGSAVVIATIVIESCFIGLAVYAMDRVGTRLRALSILPRTILTLSGLSLWLLAGISIALWGWAAVFLALGEFEHLSEAIYFSSVSATTLGYGDVVLSEKWQLLSGFIAANGLVLFSLNTAFLFEVLRRLGEAEKPES